MACGGAPAGCPDIAPADAGHEVVHSRVRRHRVFGFPAKKGAVELGRLEGVGLSCVDPAGHPGRVFLSSAHDAGYRTLAEHRESADVSPPPALEADRRSAGTPGSSSWVPLGLRRLREHQSSDDAASARTDPGLYVDDARDARQTDGMRRLHARPRSSRFLGAASRCWQSADNCGYIRALEVQQPSTATGPI